MIETKFRTINSTPHDLAALTADQLDTVSGGGGISFTFEVPYSIGIYIGAAAVAAQVGAVAAGGIGGLAFAAGMGADGLLNAWAESKMSNTRKSN